MAQIFNLKTSQSQLTSGNLGMSDMHYVQYSPTRDVSGANFPGGTQHIKFTTSGKRWWIPARTYLRLRAKLTDGQGNALVLADDAAPAMGLMASLFQSMEFRINGTVVSRITDYVAQIDALDKRTSKSKAWLDSAGASTNFYQSSFEERQFAVTDDGFHDKDSYYTDKYLLSDVGNAPGETLTFLDLATPNQVTILVGALVFSANGGAPIPDLSLHFKKGDKIYIEDGADKIQRIIGFASAATTNDTLNIEGPALTAVGAANLVAQVKTLSWQAKPSRRVDAQEFIWQPPLSIFKVDHAMPAGQYELVMYPQNSNVYEQLAFQSKYFEKISGVNAEDIHLVIDKMYLYVCQIEGIRVENMSYLLDLEEIQCQKRPVAASTGLHQEEFTVSAATCALTCAFQDNRAGSSTLHSPSLFRVNGQSHDELKLIRFYLNYAGDNRPKPDADPLYQITNWEDYTVQRYVDTMMYSGTFFNPGGCETIEEWHERGAYYHFVWPRDGTDRSTRVIANYSFHTALTHGSVLLFSKKKVVAGITIEKGNTIRVVMQDM